MSEVAVKIYETKRDIQRIHLNEPLYGKNGTDQTGKWVDSDTGQPVHELVYHRIGHYQLNATCVGTDLEEMAGPFDEVDGEYLLSSETIRKHGNVIEWETHYFVSRPNLQVPIFQIEDLKAASVLEHYYFVLRYLDDH